MDRRRFLQFLILVSGWTPFWIQAGVPSALEARSGYLVDVEQERRDRVVEIVITPEPPRESSRPLKDLIFEQEVKHEIVQRYEEEFGRTHAEQNLTGPNISSPFQKSGGALAGEGAVGQNVLFESMNEETERQRRFGEFMFRKLTEHHVDEYVKSSPSMKSVYKLKERVSKVDVEVKKGYKFKTKYALSVNRMDVRFSNPYDIDTRLSLQMDPGSLGPSSVQNTILQLKYPVTRKVQVASYYESKNNRLSMVGSRALTNQLHGSLTGSTYLGGRFQRVLIGLSWSQ